MHLTHNDLRQGCLLRAIAHAIMTNVYPDLAWEVSWDGNSVSLQNGCGIRSTVTFLENACVGAIRNERGSVLFGEQMILKRIADFPPALITAAQEDTLQYLLEERDGMIAPAVTSMFWCDSQGLRWASKDLAAFRQDFSVLNPCALPAAQAMEALRQYYEMEPPALALLQELYRQKSASFEKAIYLTDPQKGHIPGRALTAQCREAFAELNIFLT